MTDKDDSARRTALRQYVAQFVEDPDEQDSIVAAVEARSTKRADDEFHAREEIAWRAIEAAQRDASRIDATFELMYRLFWRRVLGRARRWLLRDGDAEAVAQEVFRRCLENFEGLDRLSGRLSGFLATTTDRLAIDCLRRQKRGKAAEAKAQEKGGADQPSLPPVHSQRREQAEAFWRNIVDLGAPHQSLALLLVQYLQWKPKEVVDEWISQSLSCIADWVEPECRAVEEYASPAALDDSFAVLREQLDSPVGACNAPEDRERLEAVWEHLAGDVALEAYCGESPADQISRWSFRLGKRVRLHKLEECPELFEL